MHDFIFAARTLRKNPGFGAVAILTLALGVGANTTIFSVIKAVLLDQLPFRDPALLVAIATSTDKIERPVTVDYTTTHDLRERTRSFESMSLYRMWRSALVGDGDPELVNGLRVGHDYFDTLGVRMQLGRAFRPEEDRLDQWKTVVILSHSLWMRRFGGDPNMIGRVIRLKSFPRIFSRCRSARAMTRARCLLLSAMSSVFATPAAAASICVLWLA
jgi:hypothetical protein